MRLLEARGLRLATVLLAALALFAARTEPASSNAAALSDSGSAVVELAETSGPTSGQNEAPPEPSLGPEGAGSAQPSRCPPEPPIEGDTMARLTSLARMRASDFELWGSASLGTPTRGSLFGGVELESREGIVRAGGYGWATGSVVRSIERAVAEARRCHPGSPPLYVGDLAREHGGWLRPHRSHQSGLDADIGYFYLGPASWYQRATAQNLDRARTWALVRALYEGGNVETIFMDLSIQRLLQAHIATLPASERPTTDLFERPLRRDALIRHAWGHATHFHVRFRDPEAAAFGQRLSKLDPSSRAARR